MTARTAAELEREGWTRRSVLDEPRLGEAVRMYRALGFEVLCAPLSSLAAEGEAPCAVCFGADADRHQVLFTRPGGVAEEGEAFG